MTSRYRVFLVNALRRLLAFCRRSLNDLHLLFGLLIRMLDSGVKSTGKSSGRSPDLSGGKPESALAIRFNSPPFDHSSIEYSSDNSITICASMQPPQHSDALQIDISRPHTPTQRPDSRNDSLRPSMFAFHNASRSTQDLSAPAAEGYALDHVNRSTSRLSVASFQRHPSSRASSPGRFSVTVPSKARGRPVQRQFRGHVASVPSGQGRLTPPPHGSPRRSSPVPSLRMVSPGGGAVVPLASDSSHTRRFFPIATPWIERDARNVAMCALSALRCDPPNEL